VKKFPSSYITQRFITVFTRTRHWFLSWAGWISFTPSHAIYLKSILHYHPIYAQVFRVVAFPKYEGVSKRFRTESIMKYTLTTIDTRWEAIQRVMAAKVTRLTHKIAIQLHLVAQSCTICSSRSRRPVRKLLDTHSYISSLNSVHPRSVADPPSTKWHGNAVSSFGTDKTSALCVHVTHVVTARIYPRVLCVSFYHANV
jgi:hypothetical protein